MLCSRLCSFCFVLFFLIVPCAIVFALTFNIKSKNNLINNLILLTQFQILGHVNKIYHNVQQHICLKHSAFLYFFHLHIACLLTKSN